MLLTPLTKLPYILQRVSFYGFIMALVKSDSLNYSIGKLPPKHKLLDYDGDKETRENGNERTTMGALESGTSRGGGKGALTKYALTGMQMGYNGAKYGLFQNGMVLQNANSVPSSPLPGVHHSRLHTPVSMTTRASKTGTAVGGSEEALESGVGASVDGSGVESSDSSREPSTDDDDTDDDADN